MGLIIYLSKIIVKRNIRDTVSHNMRNSANELKGRAKCSAFLKLFDSYEIL
jgi:hypothetical protein